MVNLLTFLILPATVVASYFPLLHFQDKAASVPGTADNKVPVELGVMSRCPDALLCESLFNDILESVKDKVDLSLVYVARVDPSDPVFGAWCKHGPEECAGNVQQLCVKKHEPWANWWEFVQCQNFHGRYEIGLPEIALKCAEAAGIDWEAGGAGKCAGFDGSGTGQEGLELLKQSILLGQKLGITNSCTVLINHRSVCVHDGTWKQCEAGHEPIDFVNQIEDEYRRLNSV